MKYISTPAPGMPAMLGFMALALLLLLPAVQAADIKLSAQLVWGTDEAKPKADGDQKLQIKDLDPKIRKKLESVFKWKNYFLVKEEKCVLPTKDPAALKMSEKCRLELRLADPSTLEVKLFGEGKLTTTKRQALKALTQGEILVIAGDDKAKFNDAWFVVLSCPPP